MELARLKFVHRVILPVLLLAIATVGYFSFQTGSSFARLGEQSIANSTLWFAQDKVDRFEQQIIGVDNLVFKNIDLAQPQSLETPWKIKGPYASNGVRDVAILSPTGKILAFSSRARHKDKIRFKHLLRQSIAPDLKLDQAVSGRLYHLHRRYRDSSYLISYKTVRWQGTSFVLVAHHDTGYLLRSVFPDLLTSESGNEWINVVDENNRRIFGESLSQAGDYVVGHRFPTTLYGWRLQVAPSTAPLLKAHERSTLYNQAALIALCLAVIFGSVVFSLYVATQERKLAELKSDFIANVSHELKTPLSVIRMFAEMLATNRVANENKKRDYLSIISRESERLSSLIQNVLDFAALERGKQRYELAPGNVLGVVKRAIESFRYRLDQLDIRVELTHQGGAFEASFDEQSILLSVINLLDNAVKHGGGKLINVTVEQCGRDILIGVRDHGPGIPQAELKRVFERFYRTASAPGVRGSGIGLSLVKHIVNAHRGRAWAENAEDGGAQMWIAIPKLRPSKRPVADFSSMGTAGTTPEEPHV